jgi:membrane-bound lytic murein transglycosylase D
MIQNELRERGMPEDLLYLAMIESGLNPTAYSKAHASGMWQFISETGQRYGLEVSRTSTSDATP